MANLSEGLLWYLAFLFSMVVHEASHAYAGMKLGDLTAWRGGQVTLDPIPHIRREPFGTVAVPLISYLMGGWMIGWASAPYDPHWARAYPQRSALMALAGPGSNLLLTLLAAAAIRLGVAFDVFYAPERINFSHITTVHQDGTWHGIAVLLSVLFSLNLILLIFNLLPIPPLDGSGIVPLFLNRERAVAYMDFIHHPQIAFFGILVAWKIFAPIFDPIHLFVVNLLYPGHYYH